MRAALVLLALFAGAFAQENFYLCEYVVPNFCATPQSEKRQSTCMSDPSITLQGTTYDITDNFNVISFGDFNADTSDVEGRVLVAGNGNMGNGFSIGALVYTKGPGATDQRLPYSAIFGGNLVWGSGEVLPTGNDFGCAAYEEDLYVGGTFTTTEASLKARLTANTEASFTTSFQNAQSFYDQLSQTLAAITDNAQINVQYGEATVTCDAATSYSVTIGTVALASIQEWKFDASCLPNVQMVINVANDGTTVSFQDSGMDPSARDTARTVFNIVASSGRTISFTSASFYGILLAPYATFAASTTSPGDQTGIFIVGDVSFTGQLNRINCSVPQVPNTPSPCVSFEAVCTDTSFNAPGASITGDTRDYNVISFGNFIANTGDIEGRLMVQNNLQLGAGYSIGYMLSTLNDLPDRSETYSVIAGGDCTWVSGAVYPSGSGSPFPGNEESIFCGGQFSGAADLAAEVTGTCGTSGTGCLASMFNGIYGCYKGYSSESTAFTDNAKATVAFDALVLTCTDDSLTSYSVSFDASLLQQATYYLTDNCNYQAYWNLNIQGGDVYLSGDSFPAPPGAVLYNIAGTRTIYVDETAVNGHILAPDATLNQTGGVILGKVVVADVIMALQINLQTSCQTLTNVNVPVQNGPTPTPPGSNTLCPSTSTPVAEYADFASSYYPEGTQVLGEAEGCMQLNNGPVAEIQKNAKVGKVAVPSNAGGAAPPAGSNQSNSASAIFVSLAIVFIALLF